MLEDLSSSLYLGNTSTINEQSLLDYCSNYGQVHLGSFNPRQFRDFHLVQFATRKQCQSFLQMSPHRIDSIVLEVKPYLDLFDHHQRFDLDRKLFLGPIEQKKNLNTIIQFYKLIDGNLLASSLDSDYLLLEFSNAKYRQVIFEQKAIPKTLDDQIYEIHLPVYPKEYQICVRGLNEQITREILVKYFQQRTVVISCQMNSRLAIIELEDAQFVAKLLQKPKLSLQGTDLSLSHDIPTENRSFESELVELKLEYERLFSRDRSFLDQAFIQLITEQRLKLVKPEENLLRRL